MFDALQQQFPQAFALVERIPNPRVARAPVLWSVLAAFGAGFFAWVAIVIPLTLFARLFGLPTEWVGGVATAGATATALSVAYTSAGRDAVLICASIFVLEHFLSLMGTMRFCLAILSDAPFCSPFSYVLGLWPRALGIAVAYRLVHWWRVAEGNANPLLEVAGALALAQTIVSGVLGALLVATSPLMAGLLLLLAAVAGGAACGLVILRRVAESRQWGTLGVIAVVVVGTWLFVGVPGFVAQVGIGGAIAVDGLNLIAFASPLVEVGIAAVVLYMAAARKLSTAPGQTPPSV
jgi:hypothetical protein